MLKKTLMFLIALIPFIGPAIWACWYLAEAIKEQELEFEKEKAWRARLFILQQPGGAAFLANYHVDS